MRIDGWRIDGFGVFADTTVSDLPAGLTVVSGPNEAGKSTLLAFLRGVLFGFPDGRMRARRYEPVNGGRHGGMVRIADSTGGVWTVERYVDPRVLVVRRPDGSLAEDHELTDLLGGADATLFGNVFAFGLTELDGFELLDSDAVRDRVFSAGVVGAGRSARDAINSLDSRRIALLRPRGRCAIRELTDELRTVTRELAQARGAAVDLLRRRDDVDRLAALADARRAAAEACRDEQRRLRSLLEVWPVRLRVADIDDELADLVDEGLPDGVDDDIERRFERVVAEHTAAVVALEAAELDLATAIERRDAVVVDDALGELADDVRSLAPEIPREEARLARIDELGRAVHEQSTILAEQLDRLGPGWDRQRLVGFDVSIPTVDEVRRRGQQLSDAEAKVERLAAERAALERSSAEVGAALTNAEASLSDETAPTLDDLARRTSAVRELRTILGELATAEAEVAAAARSVTGLRSLRASGNGAVSRTTLATALVSAGIVLAVLALPAATLWESFAATVALVTVGLPTAVAGGVMLLGQRSNETQGSEVEAQITASEQARDVAATKADRLHTSVQALALVLGLPQQPSLADVEACAAELAGVEERARSRAALVERALLLADERREAEERLGVVVDEHEAANADAEEVSAVWVEWTSARHVPSELRVDALNDLFTAIERARSTLRALDAAERERDELEGVSGSWRRRAAGLLDQMGQPWGSDDLLTEVRTLAARAEAQMASQQMLGERTVAVAEAEHRAELVFDRLAVARAGRDELLVSVGAHDDAGFRQVMGRWRRYLELTAEREQAIARIHGSLGRGAAADEPLAELERGDRAGWDAALDEAATALPQLEAQHEAAIRMHHDAGRQLEELSASADVADASLRWESARTRLADAVAEWHTLTAARDLIAATLARYERERQPAVLGHAQEMFAAVTDGHHVGLSVVDGELSIIDHKSRRLATDDLSRGTAEQLYLCLRFGLATEMATHTALPFVMDDVLVNFDPGRTRAMAEVIADIATSHQVLLFTCQPSSVDALLGASPEARVIELPRHGGRDA
ncbi:MAG: AAA family ATPase [Acidimicrobiia bacterium]|nr:AAA family ATPase [Acidimicrobiia bacterium]